MESAGTKESGTYNKEYLVKESLRSFYGSGKKEAKSQVDMHSQFYGIHTENAHLPPPKKKETSPGAGV